MYCTWPPEIRVVFDQVFCGTGTASARGACSQILHLPMDFFRLKVDGFLIKFDHVVRKEHSHAVSIKLEALLARYINPFDHFNFGPFSVFVARNP